MPRPAFQIALDCTQLLSGCVILAFVLFFDTRTRIQARTGDAATSSVVFISGSLIVMIANLVVIFAGSPPLGRTLNNLVLTAGLLGGVCYVLERFFAKLDSLKSRGRLRTAVRVGSYVVTIGGGVFLGFWLLDSASR
jgi:hypothetical protein